ncbi:MAG: PhnD/SsuA/transferrin family substrate-binding protein [Ilumatobacteraceae bacterium]
MTLAALGMYPFAHLRGAYDRLWAAVRTRLDLVDAPEGLSWDVDVHESWRDPALVLGQACGWPLATVLTGVVAVIGSFDVVAPFAHDGRYRSVIVARRPLSVHELRAAPGVRAAVNGLDSLSGWVSLCAVWGGRPPVIVETGAHVQSMHAVAVGDADVASIDAVTFEHAVSADPRLGAALHVVDHGPLVPTLPLVCAASRASTVGVLRAAIDGALADPAMGATCQALRIRRLVPFGREAFDGLLGLAPPSGG